jgi:hypothetical protein
MVRAGGFGFALLMQYYLTGGAFAPVWVGWVFMACAVAWHLWVWIAVDNTDRNGRVGIRKKRPAGWQAPATKPPHPPTNSALLAPQRIQDL